jgi:dihydroorotate dehydrogenase (fumarate)
MTIFDPINRVVILKNFTMIDLSTTFMGLPLRNPIIAGSSGLMNNLEYLKQLDSAGIGAVVLKSIFEEQISIESEHFLESDSRKVQEWKAILQEIEQQRGYYYDEALTYIRQFAKEHTLDRYLTLISEAKKRLSVPVIASIHCVSQYHWSYFAKRIEEAGADALELNVYVLPSDAGRTGSENEQVYFDVVEQVKNRISIPVSLKIGYYFSSLVQIVTKLSQTGISALTLFNRPYHPDIDIEQLKLSSKYIFSNEDEYIETLRWVAILSGRVQCDIAASTGIHDYTAVAKQLLAGASAVQIASALYAGGPKIVHPLLKDLEEWMRRHDFRTIDRFKGLLSQDKMENPAAFERVQFMKYYSKVEEG